MKKFKRYAFNGNASQYSLHVRTDTGSQFVTFASVGYGSLYASGAPTFSTANESIQQAIENSKAWEDGKIILLSEEPMGPLPGKVEPPKDIASKDDDNLPTKPDNASSVVAYDEVTKFRDAQDILTSPPYNVAKTSPEITSKERIHAKAAELGVSFPNLK